MNTKIAIFVFILFTTASLEAQWLPDFRLTNDPGNSLPAFNNAFSIVSSGDTVHVVWYDNRDPGFGIYYKRSTDGGNSFGPDIRLTPDTVISSYFPSIALSGSQVHVVWHDSRDENKSEIYYKRSTDAGLTWEPDIRLTNSHENSQNPCVKASGQEIHVVWTDSRDGNYEIYYKRSTDGGVSWEVATNLTNNTETQSGASIAVLDSVVHVTWVDNRDGNNEIYYKKSSDGGMSWGPDSRLTNDPSFTSGPSIAVTSRTVNITWHDQRDGNNEIYYKRSTDWGISWESDTRITSDSNSSLDPSLAASDSTVHIVWWDDRDGNYEIYYIRSTDVGLTWESTTRITNDPAVSHQPFISLSNSEVHLIWADLRDGDNNEIYYKRYEAENFTGVVEISKDDLFTISPNPAKDIIRISITQGMKNGNLEIFNALGEYIYTEKLENKTQFLIYQPFAAGIYYVRVRDQHHQFTSKLIISTY